MFSQQALKRKIQRVAMVIIIIMSIVVLVKQGSNKIINDKIRYKKTVDRINIHLNYIESYNNKLGIFKT